jgi:putative NIF3 family GTP cyclohydrolase 1 type 2
MTRRTFVQLVGAAAAGASVANRAALAQSPLTANDVVDRVKAKLATEGMKWSPSAFDGFHLGSPDIQVNGIALTFQPGLDVLQRAIAKKKNFVICHECSFWDGFDPVVAMKDDPVAQAKIRFAEENKMAVWRIHDHWHRRKPDPIFHALAVKLGWVDYYDITNRPGHYTIPEASLEEVARHVQEHLETKNVVVVGDKNMRVKTVGDSIHNLSSSLPSLHNCDVTLVGETPEHDTFEYVRDAMALGQKKAVIMISHERLEEWGMEAFVDWFKPEVPGIPMEWVSTGDYFKVPSVRV